MRAPNLPSSRLRSGEEGNTMIEFALSLAIVVTLLIGCVEACLALYTYQAVNEYARMAARYAEVHGSTCVLADGTTSCYMGDNNADGTNTALYNYLKAQSLLGVSTANLSVKPVYTAVPGGACQNLPNCNGSGDYVTVTVVYQFPYSIPFLPANTLHMASSSAMAISQ